jgi:hypothetical protein
MADNEPCEAERVADSGLESSGGLSVLSGQGFALWTTPGPCGETNPQLNLQVAPDKPAIIGQCEGREVPYLDPAYHPTRVVPGTGQSVLKGVNWDEDLAVSRGHFMLRATTQGILLVNGVPQRGGDIRSPMNLTWLLEPERRVLEPGLHPRT